jgi:hypothetical protein
MRKIFQQSKNVAISYKEKDTIGKLFMKMKKYFAFPIVTCHIRATNLGQQYYIVNWISSMTPQ